MAANFSSTPYILLPALTHAAVDAALATPFDGELLVWAMRAGAWEATMLQAALASQPRSVVLLHPADAPLAIVSLPPLPATRREAALRVVLEDRVLGEMQSVALTVQPLGGHRFAVAYCERSLLAAVQHALLALGANQISLGALAAHLPEGASHTWGGWQIWADAQGAGALPADQVAQGAAPDCTLKASTLRFNAAGTAGGAWKRWRWAAYAALVCLVVGLLGQFAYWRSLVAADAQAQTRINAAFKKALPNTPQVDALKQLQRAANGAAQGTALTAALAQLPPDVGTAAVQAFEWQAGALTVTLSSKTLGLTEAQKKAFEQRLQINGAAVRWGD